MGVGKWVAAGSALAALAACAPVSLRSVFSPSLDPCNGTPQRTIPSAQAQYVDPSGVMPVHVYFDPRTTHAQRMYTQRVIILEANRQEPLHSYAIRQEETLDDSVPFDYKRSIDAFLTLAAQHPNALVVIARPGKFSSTDTLYRRVQRNGVARCERQQEQWSMYLGVTLANLIYLSIVADSTYSTPTIESDIRNMASTFTHEVDHRFFGHSCGSNVQSSSFQYSSGRLVPAILAERRRYITEGPSFQIRTGKHNRFEPVCSPDTTGALAKLDEGNSAFLTDSLAQAEQAYRDGLRLLNHQPIANALRRELQLSYDEVRRLRAERQ
jgi:hypothetical protein